MASSPAGVGKKVMVAIDDSEFSHHALLWAVDHLRDSIAQPLVIFYVQPITSLSYVPAATYGSARMFTPMTATPELIRSLQEHQKRVSEELLARAKEICAKHGVDVETIAEIGEPKLAICEAVDNLKIDLLIMGSHGRGAFQRAFLGSVSNYCVNNAKCPVLIVKKPAGN